VAKLPSLAKLLIVGKVAFRGEDKYAIPGKVALRDKDYGLGKIAIIRDIAVHSEVIIIGEFNLLGGVAALGADQLLVVLVAPASLPASGWCCHPTHAGAVTFVALVSLL
jgi:hypothetical protein